MPRNCPWLLSSLFSFVCVAALVLAGCGKSAESYVPASDDAQASVQRALAAWQAGAAAGRIEPAAGSSIALQAVDSDWIAGKKLTAFEIFRDRDYLQTTTM
jgi:hypothetical protein